MDSLVNFGKAILSTTYDAAATSIVLSPTDFAKLPQTAPYNLVWWNHTDFPSPEDDSAVEIVRVTALNAGTYALTITRAQEGTAAVVHNISGKEYWLMNGLTKAVMDAIQTGIDTKVVAPASFTDNAIVRADGVTGKLVQNSSVIIDDAGKISSQSAIDGIRVALDVGNSYLTTGHIVGLQMKLATFYLTQTSTYGSSDHLLVIGYAGANTLSLTQGGNVGVGTTNPTAKLQVTDGGNVGDAGGAIAFGANPDNAPMAQIKGGLLNAPGTTDIGYLAFYTRPNASPYVLTERMRISDGGKVGIGTPSPLVKLHLATTGATGSTLLLTDDAVYGGGAQNFGGYIQGRSVAAQGAWTDIGSYSNGRTYTPTITISPSNYVGIGLPSGIGYLLQLGADSAGKPGAGGLWTVVSDQRIKTDIVPADLDRCYEIVKSVPLKRFAWADGVYSDEQVKDRHNLGWIAQDVQKVFNKAVNTVPFTKNEKIPDGVEEYEEQDFTTESVATESTVIEIRNGKPVQVIKSVTEDKKTLLFDDVAVVDEQGDAVVKDDKPLTHQVPRMVKKTRDKFRQEVIEDCLDLNSGQLYAAMYGCIQALQKKVESLEAKLGR